MFFAYMVLRPSLGILEPPQRPALWNTVFPRFFAWVWVAVIVLPATGYAMVFAAFGGFADAGVHVHVMHALGWVDRPIRFPVRGRPSGASKARSPAAARPAST